MFWLRASTRTFHIALSATVAHFNHHEITPDFVSIIWRAKVEKMKRKTFDKIASMIGTMLGVGLLLAGALLSWGGNFAASQVKDQLSQQKIQFPAVADLAKLPPADAAAMKVYAGQMMTTGAQANTYANHYIKVHMGFIAGGKMYEEVSGEFMGKSAALAADPKNTALAAEVATLGGQRTTLFMGSTLRGLLGFTYAFATLGSIAMIASYVAYVGGIVFLILALLGFAHLRRAATDSEI